MSGPSPATTLRAMFGPDELRRSVCVVHDHESTYRDGGEGRVLDIVRGCSDLGSASDEAFVSARTWAERYHLSPDRANVVRALDLPPESSVLEIGAGCGAVTRYLGECCAVVDAVEPVPARAAVARERCRDLDSVAVFVGHVADVPAVEAYDIVVVVGVLEYVAGGADDRDAYVEFLSDIAARLKPGGSLVLAIENKLGVKYVVGAPEDHTLRNFDSIENYPQGGQARTFSRAELAGMLGDAGLGATFYGAFPDYKLPRVVLGDIPERARSLYHRIPRFPSPDWMGDRPRLADEHQTWRTLVEAGHDVDFANSFVVVASRGDGPNLWPDGQVAAFWSAKRRPRFAAQTTVRASGDDVRFVRGAMPGRAVDLSLDVADAEYPYVDGDDFVDVIVREGDRTAELLATWADQVADGATIDHVPHNLVVTDDGDVVLVDEEFAGIREPEHVIRRGVLWLAIDACAVSAPARWPGAATVRDVAVHLGALVGLDAAGSWIDGCVADEVEVQVETSSGPPDAMTDQEWRAVIVVAISEALDTALIDLPLGDRTRVASAPADAAAATAALHETTRALHDAQARLAEFEASAAARLVTVYRSRVERVAPAGTRRRRVYSAAVATARRGVGRLRRR